MDVRWRRCVSVCLWNGGAAKTSWSKLMVCESWISVCKLSERILHWLTRKKRGIAREKPSGTFPQPIFIRQTSFRSTYSTAVVVSESVFLQQTHLFASSSNIAWEPQVSYRVQCFLHSPLKRCFAISPTFRGFRLTQFNFVLCGSPFFPSVSRHRDGKVHSNGPPLGPTCHLPHCFLSIYSNKCSALSTDVKRGEFSNFILILQFFF